MQKDADATDWGAAAAAKQWQAISDKLIQSLAVEYKDLAALAPYSWLLTPAQQAEFRAMEDKCSKPRPPSAASMTDHNMQKTRTKAI